MLRRNPKIDSRIGYFPYSRIWGSDWDWCSVQSFPFKVCFGLWIENGCSEICLNFWKRISLLRNGKEPILVTIFLPELILDQAVKLAFTNFGEVVSVFKRRHESETVEGMLKSFLQEEIQWYYQGKFLSMVVSKRKRWCCATGGKLGTCLARIVLRLHPPQKVLACLSSSRVVLHGRIWLV